MVKKIILSLVLLLGLTFVVPPLQAASPWTERDTYFGKTGEKLVFGLKNVAFGWTELLVSLAGDKDIPVALGEGVYYSLTSTLGGLLHVLTFYATNDIPLPHNGITIDSAAPLWRNPPKHLQ